ncbi:MULTISPECIES: hypothetical protein [unclassified Carboxylicivirga]|uniref:hypothetical protein n=1 Tax=Carboxylicivirga TaxID=1628153 RepID=UPI003D34F7C2
METYLTQLLELIEEAITKAPHKKYDSEIDFNNITLLAQEFLQSKAEKISAVTGIEKVNFPSPDKLNAMQMKNIVKALEKLLKAYNWEFMFPEQIDETNKYQYIRDHWDTQQLYCKEGMMQIETCTFDERKCPFPGQCKVCHSFKTDDDDSHHLCKGQIDFTDLIPEFQREDDEIRDDVDRLKKLMLQPNDDSFISGIYNYCDGRCEKCTFTHQCSSYALNAQFDKVKCNDDGAKQLKVFFKATSEIIEEELSNKGIDVEEAMNLIKENELPPQPPKHSLEKQAESYAEKLNRWFNSNQMEIESRIVTEQATGLKDDFETITWFQLFIAAKVNRAINGKRQCREGDNDELQDSLGSAKIALIAIDESIHAWNNLLNAIPSKEDSILSMLRHLSDLREDLEGYFPEARKFIRPGLDE